jgi:hypothetical protein
MEPAITDETVNASGIRAVAFFEEICRRLFFRRKRRRH